MLALLMSQLGASNGSDLPVEAGSVVGTRSATLDLTVRDDSDAELAEWAVSRFQRAGLILPDLSLAFHDELDQCHGLYGWFRVATPVHIDICGFNADRLLPAPKRLILHELAHAWAHENVDEESKRLFLRDRGLTSWHDESTPWEERGFEQAAEIIAWALMDEERTIRTLPELDPRTITQAYQLLTSTPLPPRGPFPTDHPTTTGLGFGVAE